MQQQNPFAIQELLDYSIGFLAGNMHDILVCSLVARSWVHPSQSILFRSPGKHIHDMSPSSSTAEEARKRWLKLYRALISSPHLACLVRELFLGANRLDPQTIELIARLPFTRLESLKLTLPSETESFGSLKALVALDTLRHLKLRRCQDIVDLMQHRSAPVRHCELVFQGDLRVFQPVDSMLRIVVVALELDGDSDVAFRTRLDVASLLKPFDMSRLKAFRIKPDNRVTISWKSMPKNAIEMLDIFIENGVTESLDLSNFPDLRYLRLDLGRWIPNISLSALRSIAASQKIQTLVISLCYYPSDESLFLALDSVLASLPVSEVEIEQRGLLDLTFSPFFPKLVERKLVSFVHQPFKSNETPSQRWRDLIDTL
ncbi:hypothetical protein R3P38DRAFT_3102437 [Favolaschia claudopus]|uniref:F-box domain-containing protein n=1 Tax=Favolaschia claudopus TaxID=2862362 RepID=A0AAV9ZL83_9AGAR